MKKVLNIIDSIHFGGGAQEALLGTIEQMKEVKHYCIALHGKESDYSEKFHNALENRFTFCTSYPLLFLTPFAWFRLIKKIWEISPDVIHTHLLFSYLFISILNISRLIRIPVLVTIYNLKRQTFFYEYLGYRIFRHFTKYFIVTARRSIQEIEALGVDPRKIIFIDIILNISNDILQNENIRRKYGIKDEKVIVRVSRFHPDKGYQELIEIIRELKRIYNKPFKVLLVGDGSERQRIEKYVQTHKLDNIIFCGWKINYIDYLLAADVVVCPSTNEGFGMANIAAIKNGCPFVCFATGSLEDLKQEGYRYAIDNSSAINFADSIVQIFTNPDAREYASNFAANFYEKHFSSSNLSELSRCYNSLKQDQASLYIPETITQ